MKRAFLFIFVLVSIQIAWGQIPQTMSYQGVLTDADGNVVPDGTHNLSFKIYDTPTAGEPLWAEGQLVMVENGIFNVGLGSVFPLNLPFDKPYWLGITVGAGSELTPRTEFTSSPYSLNARSIADNTVSTAKIQDGAVTSEKIASGQVVKSINSLKDDVSLVAGDNVTIEPSGNTLTISATGGGGDGHSLDAADGEPTDALFVDNNGNVGVGTTSPAEKLDVVGNIHASGTIQSGTSITIDGTNDKITASSGTINFEDENLLTTGNVTAASFLGDGSNLTGVTADNANTLDNLDSSQFLRSNTSDNFTSGTLTLDAGTTLDVDGDLMIADRDIDLDAATTNLNVTGDLSINTDDLTILKSSGNVGVGKTSPSEKLDVVGNIHASGTIKSGSSITIDGTNDKITATSNLDLEVGGVRSLRLEPNATSPNVTVATA